MRKVLVIFSLLTLLMGTWGALAAPSREARVSVSIHVPVVQRLTVVEPARVIYPVEAAGEPSLFQGVGHIALVTNVDWALSVQSIGEVDGQVYVRPSGTPSASWAHVSAGPVVYMGGPGAYDYRWDVRIEPSATHEPALIGVQEVELLFTLTKL